mgnify:CR=1 FL=1
MSVSELVHLCLSVMSDWRSIVAGVVAVVFIALANYVVRYKKKPPRVRTKPAKTESPAPAPEASSESSENSGAEESSSE